MGTRAITNVVDEEGDVYVSLYRQYDGYPEGGHGEELADYLEGAIVGNGIGMGDGSNPKFFNGAGDLAIRIVSHFKNDDLPGNFYLIPAGTDWGPDFVYTVIVPDLTRSRETNFESVRSGVTVKVDSWSKELFMGSVEEFRAWMAQEEEDDEY